MGVRSGWMVALALALILLPGWAAAESATARAKRHFEQGTTAYNIGDFQKAIEEYKEAYKAKPDPAILYNIAQAYRLAGNARQAVFLYRSYLRNLPDAPNRAEVEERIRTLEAEIAATSKSQATTPRREPVPAEPPHDTASPPPHDTAPPPIAVTTTAPPRDERRARKKAWIWGGVVAGVVVVGVALGVGLGLGLTEDNPPPTAHFPNSPVF
jgi:tetratricopeptide (TPR) repeat protein